MMELAKLLQEVKRVKRQEKNLVQTKSKILVALHV